VVLHCGADFWVVTEFCHLLVIEMMEEEREEQQRALDQIDDCFEGTRSRRKPISLVTVVK
jgi:hypothetical protein